MSRDDDYAAGWQAAQNDLRKEWDADTPSEALRQRDYEQRALALEEAAEALKPTAIGCEIWFKSEVFSLLRSMAQDWRNKK